MWVNLEPSLCLDLQIFIPPDFMLVLVDSHSVHEIDSLILNVFFLFLETFCQTVKAKLDS